MTALNVIILAPARDAIACSIVAQSRSPDARTPISPPRSGCSAPVAAVPLFVTKYHDTYVDNVLPALYGLTLHPAYLAMVFSLAAAALAIGPWPVPNALAFAAAASSPRDGGAAGQRRGRGGCRAAHSPPPVAGAGRSKRLVGLGAGLAPTLIWRQRAAWHRDLARLGHPTWGAFRAAWPTSGNTSSRTGCCSGCRSPALSGCFALRRPRRGIDGWLGAPVATVVAVATPTSTTEGSSSTSFRSGRRTRCSSPRCLRSSRRWRTGCGDRLEARRTGRTSPDGRCRSC